MLQFNNQYYFIKPNVLGREIQFDIYSMEGTLLGTSASAFENKDFEHFISEECIYTEAKIRFMQEYHVPIEEVASLDITAVDIFDTMEANWNISIEVMDEMIGSNL